MVHDLYAAGVDAKFVDDAAVLLTPGKCAVVADITEEWETPIDTRMEALGGTVIRTPKQAVQQDQIAREAAALEQEIEELRAEYTTARADRKAKLKAKIEKLETDLQSKVEEARQTSEQRKQETAAKIQALKEKAEKVQGAIKATLEARVTRIQKDFEASQAKVKHLVADQLKAAAARLEK
jgi:chromosome segregation ATPase